MGIGIPYSNQYSVGLNPNIQLNNYGRRVYFGPQGYGDSFQNNSVTLLFDENMIKGMIAQNPQIKNILAQNNIPLALNMKELYELREKHCKQTMETAVEIAKNLPPALRQQVNMANLKDAAILHDFGKVLIPAQILNKPASLTEQEAKIMNLHSELGFQLLQTILPNGEVLRLIRNHHNNDNLDVNQQILNLADKYSALTEQRVYKPALTPKQALTVLFGEVKRGEVDKYVFNALVQSVKQQESSQIVNKY